MNLWNGGKTRQNGRATTSTTASTFTWHTLKLSQERLVASYVEEKCPCWPKNTTPFNKKLLGTDDKRFAPESKIIILMLRLTFCQHLFMLRHCLSCLLIKDSVSPRLLFILTGRRHTEMMALFISSTRMALETLLSFVTAKWQFLNETKEIQSVLQFISKLRHLPKAVIWLYVCIWLV